MEMYDRIDFGDTILGVSKVMRIKTFSKTFTPSTGDFRQTLTLVDD